MIKFVVLVRFTFLLSIFCIMHALQNHLFEFLVFWKKRNWEINFKSSDLSNSPFLRSPISVIFVGLQKGSGIFSFDVCAMLCKSTSWCNKISLSAAFFFFGFVNLMLSASNQHIFRVAITCKCCSFIHKETELLHIDLLIVLYCLYYCYIYFLYSVPVLSK